MRKYLSLLFCIFSVSLVAQVENSELLKKWSGVTTYTPEMVTEELNDLAELYPTIITLEELGKSVEGRPITMVTMGNGAHKIFALGAIHAREYLTTTMLMKDVEEMAHAAAAGNKFGEYDVNQLLDSCTFYILPMTNPDGVDISQHGTNGRDAKFKNIKLYTGAGRQGYKSWKSNANGVDLNRNFAHGWANNKKSPAVPMSEEYKGVKPESEPETQILVDILDEIRPDAILSYHTQGEILYISDPLDIHKRLGREISKLTGYQRRPAGRPYGSMQDHVDKELGTFYCCVELCPHIGPYPYPESKFYERVWARARYVLPLTGAIMSGIK